MSLQLLLLVLIQKKKRASLEVTDQVEQPRAQEPVVSQVTSVASVAALEVAQDTVQTVQEPEAHVETLEILNEEDDSILFNEPIVEETYRTTVPGVTVARPSVLTEVKAELSDSTVQQESSYRVAYAQPEPVAQAVPAEPVYVGQSNSFESAPASAAARPQQVVSVQQSSAQLDEFDLDVPSFLRNLS